MWPMDSDREVGAADQHIGLAVPLQEGLPCLMRQGQVKIRAWYPGWFGALHRAVDHIAVMTAWALLEARCTLTWSGVWPGVGSSHTSLLRA